MPTHVTTYDTDVLLIFIGFGFSADAKNEARIIYALEQELQRELARLKRGPFRSVQCWKWDEDAPMNVGGQEANIIPTLDRANIVVFVFKEKIGPTTWSELEHARGRDPFIPLPSKTCVVAASFLREGRRAARQTGSAIGDGGAHESAPPVSGAVASAGWELGDEPVVAKAGDGA